MINILDLKRQYFYIRDEIDAAIREVLLSANFVQGEQVNEFEKNIADYCGVKNGIGVNSGTDALIVALKSCDIGKGDEVITVPFTFIASTEAIISVGAKPVFVDINPETFNIDVTEIESKITPKTKAILPVHLFGQSCEIEKILEIAKKNNLKVIEDCAQSLGTKYKNKRVGSFGNFGCFSFFPSKNLGAYGDAGMLITDSDILAEKSIMFRQHGSKERYNYEIQGLNSRLDTIQAAILNVKLKYLDKWNDIRRKNVDLFNESFKNLDSIIIPKQIEESYSTYHQYTLRILNGKRNFLQNELKKRGIVSMIYYPIPLHLQMVNKYLGYSEGDFINSETVSEQVLSLPVFPELTDSEKEFIIKSVREILNETR